MSTARELRQAKGNRMARKQARRKADKIRAGTYRTTTVVSALPNKRKKT